MAGETSSQHRRLPEAVAGEEAVVHSRLSRVAQAAGICSPVPLLEVEEEEVVEAAPRRLAFPQSEDAAVQEGRLALRPVMAEEGACPHLLRSPTLRRGDSGVSGQAQYAMDARPPLRTR